MEMNISTNPQVTTSINTSGTSSALKTQKDNDVKFVDELDSLSAKNEEQDKINTQKEVDEVKKEEEQIPEEDVKNDCETENSDKASETSEKDSDSQKNKLTNKDSKDKLEKENDDLKINDIMTGLKNAVEEISKVKNPTESDNHIEHSGLNKDNDKKKEDNTLINNDMNIQETQDLFAQQMGSNMNFNTEGQPFKDFIESKKSELEANRQDLAEEAAILSTMSENIAIAQKNMALNKSEILMQQTEPAENSNLEKTKTISNEQGIKKVDSKTNVTVETIVKYDNIIMDKNDVEFFSKLVENGSVDMNTLTTSQAAKSSHISKTLADMLAKSMQDNQPVRIDFDNNISVIIKVSKNGKISADFLPSSQVAEAYLKENLPLLRQRFDDNNIEYDELNQRKQKQDEDRDNRKKGRKDE